MITPLDVLPTKQRQQRFSEDTPLRQLYLSVKHRLEIHLAVFALPVSLLVFSWLVLNHNSPHMYIIQYTIVITHLILLLVPLLLRQIAFQYTRAAMQSSSYVILKTTLIEASDIFEGYCAAIIARNQLLVTLVLGIQVGTLIGIVLTQSVGWWLLGAVWVCIEGGIILVICTKAVVIGVRQALLMRAPQGYLAQTMQILTHTLKYLYFYTVSLFWMIMPHGAVVWYLSVKETIESNRITIMFARTN